MTQALTFNDVTLTPISHQNSLWIRAAELARALGYGRENQVSRLYRSNADEFTPEMTQVIEISDGPESGLSIRSRIFSLRGCHLVAMFARTPVAKAFRRWVLDVLEKYAAEQQSASSHPLADDMVLPASPDRPSRRTDPERKQLTAIINTWVSMAPIHYANARAQVNAHFGVASVDALTVAQVREAIAWVQAKIDALPPVPELPAAEKLPLFRNGCFYSPGVNKNHVPGPREAALMDLWQTWGQQTAGLEKEFTGMMRELERRRGDLFAVAVSDLGRNADTAFSFESLMEGLFYTHNMALHYFKEAISLQRLSIRLSVNVAVALGR